MQHSDVLPVRNTYENDKIALLRHYCKQTDTAGGFAVVDYPETFKTVKIPDFGGQHSVNQPDAQTCVILPQRRRKGHHTIQRRQIRTECRDEKHEKTTRSHYCGPLEDKRPPWMDSPWPITQKTSKKMKHSGLWRAAFNELMSNWTSGLPKVLPPLPSNEGTGGIRHLRAYVL